ncbi:hypothetical protein COLSTE_01157 [Collinsella stercoris DSM 13279]|uniref:Uncharacterized protein n=1 Tax=Collinsella stercoris DSM 13279 TaxID=445975 RepID=B6GAQ7_9ACTN|nr:hypothetical protein COLSTE_01157 [Collinsella stercoris DSM 13279]
MSDSFGSAGGYERLEDVDDSTGNGRGYERTVHILFFMHLYLPVIMVSKKNLLETQSFTSCNRSYPQL